MLRLGLGLGVGVRVSSSLDHLAEDDVLAVEVLRLLEGDEELAAVGVLACAGSG